jgi:hypothetical protein
MKMSMIVDSQPPQPSGTEHVDDHQEQRTLAAAWQRALHFRGT